MSDEIESLGVLTSAGLAASQLGGAASQVAARKHGAGMGSLALG